jgi:hypothetical protein
VCRARVCEDQLYIRVIGKVMPCWAWVAPLIWCFFIPSWLFVCPQSHEILLNKSMKYWVRLRVKSTRLWEHLSLQYT